VLACDTVFDALVRAGKKVAIVAVRDSSIDLIFRDLKLWHPVVRVYSCSVS
jgi:hypothetical protein